MWEWLGTQAQNASPFVAVFCLIVVGLLLTVIRTLWNRHEQDHDTLVELARANAEASNAVAVAMEKSAGINALQIAQLGARLENGHRR